MPSQPGMHDEITAGSIRSSQTRAGGASNVYVPFKSMFVDPIAGRARLKTCPTETFRIPLQQRCQISKIAERPRWQEAIDVRERRHETTRQRLIVLCADERIEPDQAVAAAVQPGHCRRE